MRLHLDGARIFNAEAALGSSAAELAAPAASVTFCLSKGLCAPVGSVLCGDAEFIRLARRARKQLGGGMRQVGILAAAGIVALDKMTRRLGEDHNRASQLADGLREIPGLVIDNDPPLTNMVYLRLMPEARMGARQLCEAMLEEGVKLGAREDTHMRLVTHYWIDDEALDKALAGFRHFLGG